MPLGPHLCPENQDTFVFLQRPLLSGDFWVDWVNPPLTTLSGSSVHLRRIALIEFLSDSSPFLRLRIAVRRAFSYLLSCLSKTLSLLWCPVLLLATLLLNEKPALLTLLLRAARHEVRDVLPIRLRQLICVLFLLIKFGKYYILQQQSFVLVPLFLRQKFAVWVVAIFTTVD